LGAFFYFFHFSTASIKMNSAFMPAACNCGQPSYVIGLSSLIIFSQLLRVRARMPGGLGAETKSCSAEGRELWDNAAKYATFSDQSIKKPVPTGNSPLPAA
jgi:hypothetical protein